MGAVTFQTIALGRDAASAFTAAVEHAQYMYGHGGYSGSIAEKSSYVEAVLPPRWTLDRFLDAMNAEVGEWARKPKRDSSGSFALKRWNRQHKAYDELVAFCGQRDVDHWRLAYDDKWGPAVCVELTGKVARDHKAACGRAGTRDRAFAFVGFASS